MKFGVTWWGNKWMDALKGIDFTNRIPRGKSYANTGKVYDIEINENTVSAKVRGKYSDYYNTNISFKKFTENEKEIILKTINESPNILSSLLNHELPEELYEKLSQNGIEVFPTSVKDIESSCNCPDYAHICKHIAGLVHMIAYEVDKDPFQIFRLQDCDLLGILDYETTSDNIKSIDDLFTNEDANDNDNITEIDFSIIPDLIEPIFILLNDNPVFYQSNFKDLLNNVVKSMSRYVKKEVEDYSRLNFNTYHDFARLDNQKYRTYNNRDMDEIDDWLEQYFIEKWEKPNQWEKLKIKINDRYQIESLDFGSNSPYTIDFNEEILFSFLTEISESSVDKYNRDIQFLYMTFQFTVELIKKHSIIPELFKSNDTYYIRWIPAIFDKHISIIIENLSAICPDELITYNNRFLSKKDQIVTLVSLLIRGFLDNYLVNGANQSLRNKYSDSVIRLFFFEGRKFNDIGEEGVENLINQWLSKFIINSREYNLFLVIREENDIFKVDLEVSVNNGDMENVNEVISKTSDNNLKLQLLSDTYLVQEILPEIDQSFDMTGDVIFGLDDFSEFFMNTLPLFEMIGINIILPKNLQRIFKPKLVLDISGNKNEKGYITFEDLTGFDWKIAVGENNYDINDFKEIAEHSRGLVKLANDYVILDEHDTKSLIKQIDKLPEKLNKHELMKAMLSGELEQAEVNIDNKLSEMISNIKKHTTTKIPDNVNANLRGYQETGFSWLMQNIKLGFGSILADDMGLGKTLQVLTTVQQLKDEGLLKKEKVLIIAPTSLLTNWQQEINKFTPDLTSFIFHGYKRKFPEEEYDVYLTSYGIIRRDESIFKNKKWFLTVVDEAQNIKNPHTKQSKAIKAIKSKHRIALSGTPVENRLAEYWSIFDFINKGYLTSLKKFRKNYIVPIEKERNNNTLNNFKMITEPFILRRLKTDKNVIKDLPDKITNDIYCNLSKNQISLYQETLNVAMEELNENNGIERKGIVLKLINSLKQICNHPSHFTKSNRAEISESGKMEVLINILENILDANEKVLIFTQFVQMGKIIKKIVEEKFNEEVLFLHGSLSRKQRDEMIEKFQNNSQNKIFLLSLKAGGTGLNLTAASNVIHYDLWWNPAVENQATDRAYRIGQNENVMVYRFITTGTFEEKNNEMIQDKKELAEITVGSGEKFITEMNDNELKEMLTLRKG